MNLPVSKTHRTQHLAALPIDYNEQRGGPMGAGGRGGETTIRWESAQTAATVPSRSIGPQTILGFCASIVSQRLVLR